MVHVILVMTRNLHPGFRGGSSNISPDIQPYLRFGVWMVQYLHNTFSGGFFWMSRGKMKDSPISVPRTTLFGDLEGLVLLLWSSFPSPGFLLTKAGNWLGVLCVSQIWQQNKDLKGKHLQKQKNNNKRTIFSAYFYTLSKFLVVRKNQLIKNGGLDFQGNYI